MSHGIMCDFVLRVMCNFFKNKLNVEKYPVPSLFLAKIMHKLAASLKYISISLQNIALHFCVVNCFNYSCVIFHYTLKSAFHFFLLQLCAKQNHWS